MKRVVSIVIVILLLCGIALAESNAFRDLYAKLDWLSTEAAEKALLPEGLTEREAEIYRAGYANGYYNALHPAYEEGMYVLNLKTKKFHLSSCPSTLTIDLKNRQHSSLSPDELMAQGYKPCGQCHPDEEH